VDFSCKNRLLAVVGRVLGDLVVPKLIALKSVKKIIIINFHIEFLAVV